MIDSPRRLLEIARRFPRFAGQLRRMALTAAANRFQPVVDGFREPWPSDRELPARAASARPAFVFDPRRVGELAERFGARYRGDAEAIVDRATRLADGRIDVPGWAAADFSKGIDWDLDFAHGIRFDRRHYRRQVTRRYDGSDVKVPWELARMRHLPVLALAYRLTGDARFAVAAHAQIEDFARNNPPRIGIHWVSAMEVGLRITSVALAATLLADWFNAEPDRWRTLLRLALASGRFIRKNLEYSVVLTSNHYLANLLGLLAVGVAFPELREADRWREFALREFREEIGKQFFADGANFEQSMGYHRYALEICAAAYLIDGAALGADFARRLASAFRFVTTASHPDGTVPLFGDNDSGRVFEFFPRPDADLHYLCELGTALFGESMLVRPVELAAPDVFWLTGGNVEAVESARPVARRSIHLADTGRMFFEGARMRAVVLAGPVGQNGNGGHGHNDALSVLLFAGGAEVLADPGTCGYTLDLAERDLYRSTRSHSTVEVDGQEINPFVPGAPFRMPDRADARGELTEPGGWLSFAAVHSGYERLADPVTVRRTVWFHPEAAVLVVDDRLGAIAGHAYAARFILGPDVSARRRDPVGATTLPASPPGPSGDVEWIPTFDLVTPGGTVAMYADSSSADPWEVVPIHVSPKYGVREPSSALVRAWRSVGPSRRFTAFVLSRKT